MKSKTQLFIISFVSGWLLFFAGIPLLLLLVTSFLGQDSEKFYQLSFSLQSYLDLYSPTYLSVFTRSIKLAAITTVLCLLIGYPFAWFTCRVVAKYRLIILIMLMIPFWTNSLVRTYAVRMVLGTKGIINNTLIYFDIIDTPIRFMYTEFAVILGFIYLMLPFMILPLYANMEKFDYRLIEVSRDLGARSLHVFRKIIWPLTQPGVVSGCIMVFVPTMGMFYVATLLGGAKTLLIGNLIQQQFLVSHNWPLGSAMSVILIIIMAVMLISYGLIFRNYTIQRISR